MTTECNYEIKLVGTSRVYKCNGKECLRKRVFESGLPAVASEKFNIDIGEAKDKAQVSSHGCNQGT